MGKIAIVGEAWGEHEAAEGRPFVGPSGRILTWLLSQSGIDRNECLLTNVFNFQPKPRNDIINLCGTKDIAIPGYPALIKGKYVRNEFAAELPRLYTELSEYKPNIIIALGATASWALLRTSGIRAIRGAPSISPWGKVLPTYHPAAMMRDWTLKPIILADLEKARLQSEFPEYRRPERQIWVEPSFDDLLRFEREYIDPSLYLSIDIETIEKQITCIGFAPRRDIALVVPIFSQSRPDGNYWCSLDEELAVWNWIRRQCAKPKKILFQNGLYDMRFLWTSYGITVPNAEHDTMLLHHSLQPEMEKGLAFLGSIYTDEAAWKIERKKNETLKRED